MRTIAHISDVHFGAEDPAVVEGLVADLAGRDPAVLVCSGDLTMRARAGQFRDAKAFLDRLPTPQIVIPGNHDIPLFDVARRFLAPVSTFTRIVTNDLRPSYQDEELLVIGVNTARPFSKTWDGFWKDGKIGAGQLLDVELRNRDVPADLFRVVVTHHPFIPPPHGRSHGIVRGAGRALETLASCGVDLLLAGHLHRNYSGDVLAHHEAASRSILSVQAGTATSVRRRDEPNAYNWITVYGKDRVAVEVRAWTGSAFDRLTVETFDRVGGAWVAGPGSDLAGGESA